MATRDVLTRVTVCVFLKPVYKTCERRFHIVNFKWNRNLRFRWLICHLPQWCVTDVDPEAVFQYFLGDDVIGWWRLPKHWIVYKTLDRLVNARKWGIKSNQIKFKLVHCVKISLFWVACLSKWDIYLQFFPFFSSNCNTWNEFLLIYLLSYRQRFPVLSDDGINNWLYYTFGFFKS